MEYTLWNIRVYMFPLSWMVSSVSTTSWGSSVREQFDRPTLQVHWFKERLQAAVVHREKSQYETLGFHYGSVGITCRYVASMSVGDMRDKSTNIEWLIFFSPKWFSSGHQQQTSRFATCAVFEQMPDWHVNDMISSSREGIFQAGCQNFLKKKTSMKFRSFQSSIVVI